MRAPSEAASGGRAGTSGRRLMGALAAALVLVAALMLLARGFGVDPHAVPSVLAGQQLPAFDLTSLDGAQLSDRTLRGRPALINFWSSWCIPCRAEHPLLQQAAATFGDRVRFVGVIFQDEADQIRPLLQRADRFVHLADPGSRLAIDLGVAGVPESFLVAADGRIVHKQVGAWGAEALHAQLTQLAGDGGEG